MTQPYPDYMFDEAEQRETDNEIQYWRKRLRDLEKGTEDEDCNHH